MTSCESASALSPGLMFVVVAVATAPTDPPISSTQASRRRCCPYLASMSVRRQQVDDGHAACFIPIVHETTHLLIVNPRQSSPIVLQVVYNQAGPRCLGTFCWSTLRQLVLLRCECRREK